MKSIKCNKCQEEQEATEVERKDFLIRGEPSKNTCVKYKCNECGTINVRFEKR